jgi:hypothetical protein
MFSSRYDNSISGVLGLPGSTGGVVLLVIAGVLMLWRRKRRRRRQQLEDLKYSLPIVACDPGQLTLMSPEE